MEQRAGVRLGELDVTLLTPELIVDRSGVLHDLAMRRAETLVAAPRSGRILGAGWVRVPAGRALSVGACMGNDADGHRPALPYVSFVVLGHPDPMLPLAVLVTLASARPSWTVGEDVVQSLEFSGATPDTDENETVALPWTF